MNTKEEPGKMLKIKYVNTANKQLNLNTDNH